MEKKKAAGFQVLEGIAFGDFKKLLSSSILPPRAFFLGRIKSILRLTSRGFST